MVKKNGECLQSWPFSAIVELGYGRTNIRYEIGENHGEFVNYKSLFNAKAR
jgi:hypothetical protein